MSDEHDSVLEGGPTENQPLERLQWAQLAAAFTQFNATERRIMLLIASRLLTGRAEYGPMSLDNVTKDLRAEATFEWADGAIYGGMELLRRAMSDDDAT